MKQHELRDLFPGSAGGRAVLDRRGTEYFRQLGARGGRTTTQRYGRGYMRLLGARGGTERRRRLYSRARLVRPWYGGLERRVPYWPAKTAKRRKRPIFVAITLEEP